MILPLAVTLTPAALTTAVRTTTLASGPTPTVMVGPRS